MPQGKKEPNLNKIDDFWKRERVEIGQRNVDCSTEHERNRPELRRRLVHRTALIVTCMDERCGLVENPLDLLPSEAIVMASAGGRISGEDFERLYGEKIRHSIQARRQAAVHLITHECVGHPDRGCAAFRGDVTAQKAYFAALQADLRERYPEAYVHTLMQDTGTNRLTAIDADRRDDHLSRVLTGERNLLETPAADLGHAGYGLYVGDAYRAWVREANRFLRLSALDPNLPDDLRLGITVLTEHSSADFSLRPLVIQVDNPIYPEAKLSGACRRNIEAAMAEISAEPDVRKMISDGRIRVIKTETEMGSQRGFAVGG